MRTKNVIKNIIVELLLYTVIGIVGFFKIKFFITYIGSEMNGYFQVINNIVTYVFLAEAGLTSGVIYKLYKPMATKNYDDAKALYKGAKRIFRIIGAVVLALSILALIVFPFIVDATGKDLFIVMLSFALIIASCLISYFACSQAYNAVFFSDQKKYIPVSISNVTKIVCDLICLGAIFYFRNLLVIAIIMFASKVIEEIIIYFVARKEYPWLKNFTRVDTSAEKMSKDLITHQVATVAGSNIDQIILLISKSATVVSIYASYNYIYTFISTVINKITNNISHSFGNMFALEKEDKSLGVFKEYFAFCFFLGLIVAIPFVISSRSFIYFWIENKEYVLSYVTVCLFAFNLFGSSLIGSLITAINTNGLFKETKYFALLNAVVNLVISCLLVSKFGIAGVLFGTCFAFFVNAFWRSIVIAKYIFKKISKLKLFINCMKFVLVFVILTIVLGPVENYFYTNVHSMLQWFIFIIPIEIVIVVISYLICLVVSPEIKNVFARFVNIVKKKVDVGKEK